MYINLYWNERVHIHRERCWMDYEFGIMIYSNETIKYNKHKNRRSHAKRWAHWNTHTHTQMYAREIHIILIIIIVKTHSHMIVEYRLMLCICRKIHILSLEYKTKGNNSDRKRCGAYPFIPGSWGSTSTFRIHFQFSNFICTFFKYSTILVVFRFP